MEIFNNPITYVVIVGLIILDKMIFEVRLFFMNRRSGKTVPGAAQEFKFANRRALKAKRKNRRREFFKKLFGRK